MSNIEKLKDRKRKSIMTAAFSLFSEYGIKKVKIADIAKKANVSQVTIYNHFESKEHLLREVITDYTIEKYEQYKVLLLNEDISYETRIEQYILDKINSARELNSEVIEAALLRDKELQDFLQHFSHTKALPLFVQFVKEGQQTGHINPDLSMEVILFYLQLLNKESSTLAKMMQQSGHSVSKDILQMFFYGLIGK
ncbi:TetR/AcrR family transcriptional regulator [Bacillus suaedaesalsae]|uniref:TetR/AcrR family transcriptional regulator n=1 Tax=Bacillus suaedaesalsae TaxID=2810349 RepID=A0ABS2DGG7_9BACI|nr:TetR/AcrR family transcriptional regulator [Bacillus suaedaesalsae]MBM6617571.1 TetR/AcrR family transcriptional regulator [Bacillus suaedaesalsae]